MSARWMCLDIEGTGPDPYNDRIVELCIMEAVQGKLLGRFAARMNPGRPIPPEASEIHGIRDEDVARLPGFKHHAKQIQALVWGAVLCGYNLIRYDTILLDRELQFAGERGFQRDEQGRICQPEVDPFGIWQRCERRDLTTAAKRFAGVDLTDAHAAGADTACLPAILKGMITTFGLEPKLENLIALSKPDGAIDRDGKFVEIDGVPCFNIGNSKGKPVHEDEGLLRWMLGKDFSPETLGFAQQFLNEIYQAQVGF